MYYSSMGNFCSSQVLLYDTSIHDFIFQAVVSGKTTPDVIIIQRYHDGRVEILERRLGNKGMRINVSGRVVGQNFCDK